MDMKVGNDFHAHTISRRNAKVNAGAEGVTRCYNLRLENAITRRAEIVDMINFDLIPTNS